MKKKKKRLYFQDFKYFKTKRVLILNADTYNINIY